jgi:hypothetical protein
MLCVRTNFHRPSKIDVCVPSVTLHFSANRFQYFINRHKIEKVVSLTERKLRYAAGIQRGDVPIMQEPVEVVRGAPHVLQAALAADVARPTVPLARLQVLVLGPDAVPDAGGLEELAARRQDVCAQSDQARRSTDGGCNVM